MHRTFQPAMTYINGYARAATLLYAELQNGAKHGDSSLPIEHWLVYPVYFMYRHALELSLKDILRTAAPTLEKKQRERITETHNVYTLWNMARSWVMQFAPNQVKAATPAFESMLKEIERHDPDAEAGRYEIRKIGKKSNRMLVATFPTLSPLDATAIHDGFSKMLNYIRTIWTVYAELEHDEAMMLKPPDIESFIARWLKPEEV